MISLDAWIKLNAQTGGKDKIFRLLQYLSRFLSYNLDGRKGRRDFVTKLQILENSFSTFRKLLRLGKSLEILYGTLRTLHLQDLVLRITLTFSRVYQTLYLFVDHIICIGRIGLVDINKTRWSQLADKFWLGSLILNLLRDLYEISVILQHKKLCKKPQILNCSGTPIVRALYNHVPATRFVTQFAEEHKDICIDSLKNVCDLWIPLANMGKINISKGTIGFLGTVSSIAGLIAILDPIAKLVPA
ncbi:peroxisomal biogenesis factor 11ab [Oratosquilla oratoria]|uniref:peroxisomal biogenesis factor 11ab n=1 Tax=Oratosquilla oratoria TaxID=337810 RepID=UPI003F76973C